MELVPIKIKLVYREEMVDGKLKSRRHPKGHDGNVMDRDGIGMHYSRDGKYAVTAVPQAYLDEYLTKATEAKEEGQIQVITEAEAEQFFADEKPESDEVMNDRRKIDILVAKAQAGINLKPAELKAFDANDDAPGIVKNHWKGFIKKVKMRGHKVKV